MTTLNAYMVFLTFRFPAPEMAEARRFCDLRFVDEGMTASTIWVSPLTPTVKGSSIVDDTSSDRTSKDLSLTRASFARGVPDDKLEDDDDEQVTDLYVI